MLNLLRTRYTRASGLLLVLMAPAWAQTYPPEPGIPVHNELVKSKCAACHPDDGHGNLQIISWTRTTPEGWQDALKRMILSEQVTVTPLEARAIVRYLSDHHGLAPAEMEPVRYDVERRPHEETSIPTEAIGKSCSRCHTFAKPLSWRRSPEEWKRYLASHAHRYSFAALDEAAVFLGKSAALHSPEWNAWTARSATGRLGGRWLVSATVPGRGIFVGEAQLDPVVVDGFTSSEEFNTRAVLRSVRDGSVIARTGRAAVYTGYAWRGRSKGVAEPTSPDDPAAEAREVMWFSDDHTRAEGRWFWGQYQEFGYDVTLRRSSGDPTLLAIDRRSLKIGSKTNQIRLLGDNFPDEVTAEDVQLGAGTVTNRIVSHNAKEIVIETGVAADAIPGTRDVVLFQSKLPAALAIYDRVDYVKVTPESSLAAFGGEGLGRGYQQYQATGFQRGPDDRRHTSDDLDLGPIDVSWSIEIFYEPEGHETDQVGVISPTGFFTPAANPKNNFDVWVIAKAKTETDAEGQPLVGKGYLVVTVPSYVFNGRRYVRDLDRWVDDGPARPIR
jgi:quinohemoprotein amine dehydrogenase